MVGTKQGGTCYMGRARSSNLESTCESLRRVAERFQSVEFFGDRGSFGGVGGSTFGFGNRLPSPLSTPPSLKASQEL